jgi:hypothetical protein
MYIVVFHVVPHLFLGSLACFFSAIVVFCRHCRTEYMKFAVRGVTEELIYIERGAPWPVYGSDTL